MPMDFTAHSRETIQGISDQFPYCHTHYKYKNFVSHSINWQRHEELELNYLKKGTLKIYTNTSSYIINEGEAYLVNSNVINMKHSVDPETHAIEICHHFNPILISGHFHSVFETRYIAPILTNPHIEIARFTNQSPSGPQIISTIKKLYRLSSSEDGYEFQVRNLLSDAWMFIFKEVRDYEAGLPKNYAVNENRLQFMIAYIHRHYSEKITLEDIAASANISTREAARCFKKIRGRSPVDYLIEYRLSTARTLLSDTDDSITEIALKTGFSDSAYFGKMFKKYFDLTPLEYRRAIERQRSENEDPLADLPD